MKELFISILIVVLHYSNLFGQCEFDLNCFSILVGKDASVDGSVFFAHNEDDEGQNFVDLHRVPRINHRPGEKQIFVDALDSIDEVNETYAYLWISGSTYNEEQYLNEWGVAITSDGGRSKVVNGEAKIQHNLRRLVIERARSAREAVKIAGTLVERYGYTKSGRDYLIVDPNEAWVFEVTYSKHWIAKRLPDDEVAIIPNYYVIDDFNISDTLNFLSSPDIIEYAISNGWYDPQTDKSFNFRKVYGRKDRQEAIFNIARKWVILNKLSEKQYNLYDDFPFSFKPKQKVSIQDLMGFLQNHYESTQFAKDPSYNNGCPHSNSIDTLSICNGLNDYSCITQLRNWLPADIGNIMWIAPRHPCIQPFIPWYYGITKILSDYEQENYINALRDYNIKNREYKAMYPHHACWVFDDFATKVDSCYGKEIESLKKWKDNFEMDVFNTIKLKENEILNIYKSNPEKARQILAALTNSFAEKALIETKGKLENSSR
ncbi:MAG: C69 family dipeptidase [Ignavibacteriales bacterium]|nr:C69 family dipeptidase [Ignavibacteriales bacterium]